MGLGKGRKNNLEVFGPFGPFCPAGQCENSPTLQRWDLAVNVWLVPKGRLKTCHDVKRPFGTGLGLNP